MKTIDITKIEENIYQHKCCQCGEFFFRKGKIHVTCDECIVLHNQKNKKIEVHMIKTREEIEERIKELNAHYLTVTSTKAQNAVIAKVRTLEWVLGNWG